MKAAKRSGVSVAEYIVQCCKKHPPKEKPPDEFWNLLGELYTVFDIQDALDRITANEERAAGRDISRRSPMKKTKLQRRKEL